MQTTKLTSTGTSLHSDSELVEDHDRMPEPSEMLLEL
jgi:hypothetical protein